MPDHDVGINPVPSTGPYEIGLYLPGREVEFVRNPYFHEWSAAAEPAGSPDRIVWTFGASISEEISEIETGRADWTDDSVPGVAGLLARFPAQLHVNPASWVLYASFNTRVAPFNSLLVRQAFSLAADRAELVQLLGGPSAASPTCQILPPGIPGYRPYCPFTVDPNPAGAWVGPDVAAARKLVAESGTSGMRVTFWAATRNGDGKCLHRLGSSRARLPRLDDHTAVERLAGKRQRFAPQGAGCRHQLVGADGL